jgi:hypothetical protein
MDENNKIDYQTLTRTLDLLPMAAYAVEADSRKIIFLNKKAVQEFGEIDEEPCYKHIYGLELPCPFCTFEGGKNENCNTTEEYEAYNFKNHRRPDQTLHAQRPRPQRQRHLRRGSRQPCAEKNQNQNPQPKPGNVPKDRLQNLLDAVNNEEKKIQDKVNAKKVKGKPVENAKDW